jgi:hypothetical protein
MNSLDPHKGQFIRTLSGKFLDVLFPQADQIDILDIAHGLSHAARFAGQTQEFYTVAQHCYEAAKRASQKNKLAALLHDAPEFVMGDLAAPVKRSIDRYKEIENKVMAVIATKYGFDFPFDPEIKRIDKILLEYEYNNLFLEKDKFFVVMSPALARKKFLETFQALSTGQTTF